MADTKTFSPYSTVTGFIATPPLWVPADEKDRVGAYSVYEEMYWNAPTTFRLMLRGDEGRPLYLPSGRILVDAICRFTGRKFACQYLGASAEDGRLAYEALFARERFRSKLSSGKKMGSIRGDWVLHVTGDDTKAEGTRLSLHLVDAQSYFPIRNENDRRIVKVHLAELFVDADGNDRVRRQTYEKTDAGILSSMGVYEPDKWMGEEEGNPLEIVFPPRLLPSQITQIPVYHFRNSVTNDLDPFGNSDMKGLERVFAGINQAISDEDLALALEGLGLYKSANGAPIDENGEDTDWIIGPGRVIEDESFERVPGIGSVTPMLDHLNRLDRSAKEASGVPEAAIGKIDAGVAESGIALAMEMMPLLTKAEENEDGLKDVLSQLFYDLQAWFSAYEGKTFSELTVLPTFGSAMPVNVPKEIENVAKMMTTDPPIMSATTARDYLANKVGIQFADNEITLILQEQTALAEAAQAAMGEGVGTDYSGRVRQEMEAEAGTEAEA